MDASINSIVKRSECSISSLIEWYSHQPTGTRIAILIKDYEMCQQTVFQNFILLLRFLLNYSLLEISDGLNFEFNTRFEYRSSKFFLIQNINQA